MENSVILRIYRGHPGKQYWEEFEIELFPFANICACLMEIQMNPVNREGKRVEPVVWSQGCLEEVCGSCSMLINGRPRQACTALAQRIVEETQKRTITLAPMTKFPLVRDLIIDRSSMFENLRKVHAWIDVDGAYERGPGPKISQAKQQVMYALSTCMTCGCCVEACPQMNSHSKFMGPQIMGQVRLFNANPTGSMQKAIRTRAVMGEGGINDCGNAQNCEKVCPKNIPLLDAIASIGREVTVQGLKDLFSFPDRE